MFVCFLFFLISSRYTFFWSNKNLATKPPILTRPAISTTSSSGILHGGLPFGWRDGQWRGTSSSPFSVDCDGSLKRWCPLFLGEEEDHDEDGDDKRVMVYAWTGPRQTFDVWWLLLLRCATINPGQECKNNEEKNDLIMERKKYLCHICVCDCSCFHIYMRSRKQNLILTFVCVFFRVAEWVSLNIPIYHCFLCSFPRIPRDREKKRIRSYGWQFLCA